MLPTNFYLVHDGQLSSMTTVHEELDDAIAMADEQALHHGCEWYVAGCLMPNAVAYTAGRPRRRRR